MTAQRFKQRFNDPGILGGLLADDFVGVGPLGFVLARDQWLGRFQGGLDNRAFAVRVGVSAIAGADGSYGRNLWMSLSHESAA